VCLAMPSSAAIAVLLDPAAARSTMRARRASGLQPLDLGLEQLVGHRQIADLRLEAADLVITSIGRPVLQRHLASGKEGAPPAAQVGGGHPELARQQFQILTPQQPQHRLLLAARRHPPSALARGPACASVVGALRRAHARPNVLVHPAPPCRPLPAKRCLEEP